VRRRIRVARVERVRRDLGRDGLLEGAGVRVPQVFEEMLEVDSRLAHAAILPPLRRSFADFVVYWRG
jgi:hypothetical protein